ncbi:MAG: ribonuclease III domain-containing protein [Clostridiales bacterium]|nr:ribonuclease III domain-containing protein [Clostridiales bacterium]HBM80330.1 Mini-ribonuclease 3 [Clostridiaceae bacterium]
MFKNMMQNLKDINDMPDEKINMLNPLVLAYIGDSVYELYIRTSMLADNTESNVHKLHILSIKYVKAHAQFETLHRIQDILTEEELNIVRRGRNSKSGFVPKNADVCEYRNATGFEALLGYMYLKGDIKRLMDILNCSMAEKKSDEGVH